MAARINSSQGFKFLKYWLPVILYAGLIFFLSSLPGEDIPSLFFYQDLVFHIVEYALFAFLLQRAIKGYRPGWKALLRFSWVFAIALIYAASDEFHQSFVPARVASWYDIAYDTFGILLSQLIYR